MEKVEQNSKNRNSDVPVLPEVGSMRTSPGLMRPDFSASSTILLPMRSLTEPPALKNSHLATVFTWGLVHSGGAGWQGWGGVRTELALQTLGGGNLVDPDHRSVANMIQNGIENGLRRGTGTIEG